MKRKIAFRVFSRCLFLPIVLGCLLSQPNSGSHSPSDSRPFHRPVTALKDGPQARQEKTAFGKALKESPRREAILRAKAARDTWARTYGDWYEDSIAAIQKTGDGGVVIAGSSEYYDATNWMSWLREALVLKISPEGGIEWQYTFPVAEEAASIKQTSDGGFIVVGSTALPDPDQSDVRDFWVAKLNPAGIMEWQRTYGGSFDDRAKSIWQRADGGYIVVGTTESFGAGERDIWILRLSPLGNVEWQRCYGDRTDETAEAACPTADGGLIVAGSTIPETTAWNVLFVLKLAANGDIEWQHRYHDRSDRWPEFAHCILPTGDGGTMISVKSYDMTIFLKLSPRGAIEWQRVHWESGQLEETLKSLAKSIKPTSDGGYVAVGTAPYIATRGDEICLMKLSADGVIEWAIAYGGQRYDDIGLDIEQLEDGEYCVAGITRSFGAGESDILILKLGAAGGIERLPEIMSPLSLDPYGPGGWLVAQNSRLQPHETTAGAVRLSLDYEPAEKTSRLVFSPPLLSGYRELNRSLSQAEYVDLLTWEENPNNSDLNIVQYRLYVQDSYSTARLVEAFPAGIKTYLVRDVPILADRTYSIAGVTEKGEEGMRSYVNIIKPREN